ncbi:MAG: hypothetical protein JWO41_46 [Candidatus Saccharibacteria bacterium]|nr:hypothetical protein [Candidatus Saccharibacteria bacterium]
MKQKDIAMVIGIVIVSGIISLVVAKSLFGAQKGNLTAEVVQKITADFPTPDRKYFNDKSFDPTKLITISQNDNNDPFSGSHN